MFCIKKLRLNRFVSTIVPTARRLFDMFGYKPAVESHQTAENPHEVIPFGAKKTQLCQLGVTIAEKASEMVDNPNAKPLQRVEPKNL